MIPVLHRRVVLAPIMAVDQNDGEITSLHAIIIKSLAIGAIAGYCAGDVTDATHGAGIDTADSPRHERQRRQQGSRRSTRVPPGPVPSTAVAGAQTEWLDPAGGAAAAVAAASAGTTSGFPAGNGSLGRIRRQRASLTETSARVGAYVLANPWEVRGLSISDLADRAGVSVNSINRFARELGFCGYREFSQGLALDLGRVLGSAYGMPQVVAKAAREGDDDLALVIRTLTLEMQCLQETVDSLERDMVRRAFEALQRATAGLFLGTGSAAPVCAPRTAAIPALCSRSCTCSAAVTCCSPSGTTVPPLTSCRRCATPASAA